MNMTLRTLTVIAIGLLLSSAIAAQALPNPVITFVGQESYKINGKEFTRYVYSVVNSSAYPAEMFAASPDLPPCGKNTNASRTWVDLFDERGKRLYGFCAFSKPSELERVWFALDAGVTPPSWIYVQLQDRKTKTIYKSNLADSVP